MRYNLKNLTNGYSKEEVSRYLQEIQPAPLKFNIALSCWEPATFQGRAVKFRGVIELVLMEETLHQLIGSLYPIISSFHLHPRQIRDNLPTSTG